LAPAVGFGFGIVSASTIRYMIFELLAAMATMMRPSVDSGSPFPFTWVQLSPPSVLFQSPDPGRRS
jgi:hypothetical protein